MNMHTEQSQPIPDDVVLGAAERPEFLMTKARELEEYLAEADYVQAAQAVALLGQEIGRKIEGNQ